MFLIITGEQSPQNICPSRNLTVIRARSSQGGQLLFKAKWVRSPGWKISVTQLPPRWILKRKSSGWEEQRLDLPVEAVAPGAYTSFPHPMPCGTHLDNPGCLVSGVGNLGGYKTNLKVETLYERIRRNKWKKRKKEEFSFTLPGKNVGRENRQKIPVIWQCGGSTVEFHSNSSLLSVISSCLVRALPRQQDRLSTFPSSHVFSCLSCELSEAAVRSFSTEHSI